MTATRISVSVKGVLGLDDPDRMLSELETATGLPWHRRPTGEDRVLSGGLAEILLVAAVGGAAGKATEMAVEHAVDAAKQVVGRWRQERLDPPEASVDTEPVPDGDVDAPEGANG